MPRRVTPRNIDNVTLYRKKYTEFRGVDFSTDPTQVADYRSPFCQNLIADLAGFPEKRPGWRVLHELESPINGLFYAVLASGTGYFVAHAGTKLYTLGETATEIYTLMANAKSTSFTHDGKLYILDGTHYLVISEGESGLEASRVTDGDCFIPTTVIGAPAAGGGTTFEGVNLLSPKRINSMVGDGESYVFHLDSQNIQEVESVKVDGELYTLGTSWTREKRAISFLVPAVPTDDKIYLKAGGRDYIVVDEEKAPVLPSTLTQDSRVAYELTTEKNTDNTHYYAIAYTYDETPNAPTVTAALTDNILVLTSKEYIVSLTAGTVEFAISPAAYGGGGGVDNVIIQFSKAVDGYTDRIEKCKIAEFYGYGNDNRLFFSGNPDQPNVDWQSGLDDPTYFPDTGYTKIGSDTSAIMGYLKQYGSLTIIKNDNQQDAEIFLRTATMTEEGKVIFPVQQGIKGVGAVSKYAFANLRDDPLFLAREGVFALASTAVTQERVIQDRSYYVNAKLRRESGLENAVAAVWNGFYVLVVNDKAYVADGRQRTGRSSTEQNGYEWYYWTNIPARVLLEAGGALYFGTADGEVCRLNNDIQTLSKYNDDGEAIIARWSTKSEDFGSFMRRKTLVKKGCGVMIKPYARSSIKVYVATERDFETLIKSQTMDIFTFADIDFERITFNTQDTPQVVPFNKKIKKFITIQIIFENDVFDEGFGVFGTELQYAVGNYVK